MDLRQSFARDRMPEHLGNFFHVPSLAVVIVHHRHHGKLDAAGLQPLGQLGIGLDIERAVGFVGVQRFGNEQVEVFVVKLQRGEAGGIVAHIKCGAQRIIILRLFAKVGDFALAALAGPLRPRFGGNSVEAPMRRRPAKYREGQAC